jgi:hypothetical protein
MRLRATFQAATLPILRALGAGLIAYGLLGFFASSGTPNVDIDTTYGESDRATGYAYGDAARSEVAIGVFLVVMISDFRKRERLAE